MPDSIRTYDVLMRAKEMDWTRLTPITTDPVGATARSGVLNTSS